jgi:Ser/Thr protein kinase RdoA (MazF antagonist)
MSIGTVQLVGRALREQLRTARQKRRWEADLPSLAVELWDGDVASVEFLAAGKHVVFSFRINGQPFVIKLSPEGRRGAAEINSETDWVNYLASAGVPVCEPLLSVNGNYAEAVAIPGRGQFVACVNRRSLGAAVEIGNIETWPSGLIELWGSIAGRIHAASKFFAPNPSSRFREMISEETVTLAGNILDKQCPDILQGLTTVMESLLGLPRSPEYFGLIHGDLTPANLFIHGEQLTVIDFETSSHCWFAYDLASPLYSILLFKEFMKTPADRDAMLGFFRSFLTGYLRENELPFELVARLPDFLTFLSLLNVVLFYHQDAQNRDRYVLHALHSVASSNRLLGETDFANVYADVLANSSRP